MPSVMEFVRLRVDEVDLGLPIRVGDDGEIIAFELQNVLLKRTRVSSMYISLVVTIK